MAFRAFRPNQRGLTALANGPEIRAVTTIVAEKGKAYAEAISPRDTDGGEHYQDGFVLDDITVLDVGRFPRAGTALRNTVAHAAAVEWGNERNGTSHRVLGRTLDYLRRA